MGHAKGFNRAAEDVGNIIGLEHVNLLIPDQGLATIFYISGLYKMIFRYSGWQAMLNVSRSIFIYGLGFFFLVTLITLENVPRTIGIIQPLLLFLKQATLSLESVKLVISAAFANCLNYI